MMIPLDLARETGQLPFCLPRKIINPQRLDRAA